MAVHVFKETRTLRFYDGGGEDYAYLKNAFLFYIGFCIYLQLSSVFVGTKTCSCWTRYECVQFQIELEKLAVVVNVLQTTQNLVISHCCFAEKFITNNYNTFTKSLFCLSNLSFGDALFAVAVVFCVKSQVGRRRRTSEALSYLPI